MGVGGWKRSDDIISPIFGRFVCLLIVKSLMELMTRSTWFVTAVSVMVETISISITRCWNGRYFHFHLW